MSKYRVAICVGMLFVIAGCAQQQINSRLEEYKSQLDPLVGKATEEQMISRFGIPSKKDQVGNLEIWEYHKSLGFRGTGYANGYGYSSASSHEQYDDVTLYFRSGVLSDWKAYVQR